MGLSWVGLVGGGIVSENQRQHLVVVLPGIGGSRLVVPSDPARVVWDAGFPDVGNLLTCPSFLSLDRHPVLKPMGLVRSRKLFGIWTKIDGYEHLLESLGALPGGVLDDGTSPVPLLHANMVAIGYDFRLGVAKAAEYLDGQLMPRLRALWPNPDDRRGRVIFVAHSMGGLVARYWLAQQDHAPLCRELITLGTPHRGAPLALDLLANGVPVWGVHVIKGEVRALLRSWQGVYDLLPTEPEVEDVTSVSKQGRLREVYGLPLSWDPTMAAASRAVHAEIADVWGRMATGVRPSVQPRIGFGHGTPRACVWDGRQVRVTRGVPHRPGLGRWLTDLGDGTVPVLSGLPAEMPDPPTGLWAGFRHGQIVNSLEVLERLQAAEEYPWARPTEGERVLMALGVDIPELTVAGEPTPVSVTVRGGDVAGDPGRCVARVEPDRGGARGGSWELAWDSAENRFTGLVAGLPSGGYTVQFDWEGGDALSTRASVEVLDPDQPGLEIG